MRVAMMIFINILITCISVISLSAADKPCIPRKYNYSSIVCVCNSTYCDDLSGFKSLEDGKFILYSSSMSGDRFEKTDGLLEEISTDFQENLEDLYSDEENDPTEVYLKINRNETYQKIHGFGGTFSDSTGINLLKLSASSQENLINAYFSENGLEYNMGRVPIAGSDFSTRKYAYNTEPEDDMKLSNFSLSHEDYKYKIPLIQKAMKVATSDIYLIASAWSSPLWMKDVRVYGGEGGLLKKYYQTWADYHLRFLEEYDKNNISYWAITTGNEPINGVYMLVVISSLGWYPDDQAIWIAENLGPTMKNSKFNKTLILALDDQRITLPWWLEIMSKNKKTMKYIDGISLHWYSNDVIGTMFVDETHKLFPDLFIIATEASIGDKSFNAERVQLGSWERAELYMKDIVDDLNHWHTGWIDWNLALDRNGGPNCYGNFVDAPVIVIPENDEFLKQPLFYVMGHFSKFIPRDSKKISTEDISGEIDHVAFLRPDDLIALVCYNKFDFNKTLTIVDEDRGYIELIIPPHSIHTVIY